MSTPPVKIIFACYPSLYSSIVLQKIMNTSGIEVIAVVESHCVKRRNTGWLADVLDLVRGSGLRYAFYLLWITDIFNALARLAGSASVRSLSGKSNLPIIKTKDVNASQTINMITSIAIARKTEKIYFITTLFNQKISPNLLHVDALQFVNLHPGSLPAYRGVDPVLAALNNAEQSGSVCLHQTAEQLDTGEILAQQSVAINQDESLLLNNKRFFEAGGKMLVDWLLAREKPLARAQQGSAHYYGWPSHKEVPALPRLLSLRNWRELLLR